MAEFVTGGRAYCQYTAPLARRVWRLGKRDFFEEVASEDRGRGRVCPLRQAPPNSKHGSPLSFDAGAGGGRLRWWGRSIAGLG